MSTIAILPKKGVNGKPFNIAFPSNHEEQARRQVSRHPGPLPRVKLNPDVKDLFAFGYDDIAFDDYHPQAAIKAPIAV